MFFKEQPQKPVKGAFNSIWSGGSFIVTVAATGVEVFRFNADTGAILLPAGSISTASLADSAVTTSKLGDKVVTINKLAADANLSALIASGLGAVNSFEQADGAANLLLAADAANDRACLVVAVVTTACTTTAEFEVHDDLATTFLMIPVASILGAVFAGVGVLAATQLLEVTATAGATGEIMVLVHALPTA